MTSFMLLHPAIILPITIMSWNAILKFEHVKGDMLLFPEFLHNRFLDMCFWVILGTAAVALFELMNIAEFIDLRIFMGPAAIVCSVLAAIHAFESIRALGISLRRSPYIPDITICTSWILMPITPLLLSIVYTTTDIF